jgi:phospholipid-binding lipoprotein MlaA
LLLAGAPVPADPPPAVVLPRLQAERIEVPEFSAADAGPATTAEPPAEPPAQSPPGADTATADIVVVSNPPPPPGDPLVEINQESFEATQAVDVAVVEPIAKTYEEVLPKEVRAGLRNFFRNLASPVIFINFMLQLKPAKAFETLARFTLNSTVGIGGLMDVAKKKPFYLPYRPNGFANTLGYYGVEPGPYFYLPLIGSTTLRDALGGIVDGSVMPLAVGAPFNDPKYTLPRGAIRSIDYRVEFDEQIKALQDDVDPYTTQREGYLAARQAEIDALRGVRSDAAAVAGKAVPGRHGAVAAPVTPAEADPSVPGRHGAAAEPLVPDEQSPAPPPPEAVPSGSIPQPERQD